MKTLIKIVSIILCIALVIGGIFIMAFVVKPNADIDQNRNNLTVLSADNLSQNKDAIHFLSTGSSDAILLESDGKFALIDCAEDSDNPRGFAELVYEGQEQKVLDYLKQNARDKNGNVTLDFVVGTHSHSDHIGGFDTIIADESVTVKKAYLKVYDETKITDHEVIQWDNKEVYQQMVDALNSKNVPIISDLDGTPFAFGNFTITFFNTQDNDSEKVGENDHSLGVLVEKNGAKVFLAGDIDNYSGDEDTLAPQIGKVDLLKVGHHSYSGSTTTNWLKTLNPDVCVVTNNPESVDSRTIRRITRVANSPILITGAENGVLAVIDYSGKISYYNNIHQ